MKKQLQKVLMNLVINPRLKLGGASVSGRRVASLDPPTLPGVEIGVPA